MSTPAPFRTIGRYELLEVIGRGGAAVVYLAQQRDLRRLVALKELAPVQAADSTFAARFVDESRVAGLLNHPNVVTVHEFFEADGVPFIAMEYLPQGSLRPYVGAVSLAQFAGVLEGVLAGLSHGQSHGIVHRDLKPENLLVTADGRVKIADFGVARALGEVITREVVTVAGTTIGTPAYMAPEQALGDPLTHATDLYSLGVVAYELLAGQLPFTDSATPVAVLYRHVHEPVPPINDLVPDVDPRLAEWLDRMLAKHPGHRFENADRAWEALEDVVLELLGPRWRREARLAVRGRPAAGAAPLTPAAFETSGVLAAAGAPPELVPVAPTIDELPAPPASPEPGAPREAPVVADPAPQPAPVPAPRSAATGPLTVAPRRRVPVAVTTIVRLARRHPDEAPPEERGRGGRRLAAALGLVVLAGAIVAVAIILGAGGGHPKTRPRRTVSSRPSVAPARRRRRPPAHSARRPRHPAHDPGRAAGQHDRHGGGPWPGRRPGRRRVRRGSRPARSAAGRHAGERHHRLGADPAEPGRAGIYVPGPDGTGQQCDRVRQGRRAGHGGRR